jgi:protein-S-isoprenylcysteine O-methyltransferase Ste14
MYVALTLLLCAWAAWLLSPGSALGPLLFALFIDRFQIVPEERAMRARFAEAYDAYRLRTRRWL